MKIVQKIKEKKQQVLRFLFGSFSATALMFTFQACYGMPSHDYYSEISVQGTVTDEESGLPVEGLRVAIPDINFADTTDNNGRFSDNATCFLDGSRGYRITVEDIDGADNGLYDTLNRILSAYEMKSNLKLTVQPHHDNQ